MKAGKAHDFNRGRCQDENWYPEEERERDRRNLAIASYKCCKEYERILKGEVQV